MLPNGMTAPPGILAAVGRRHAASGPLLACMVVLAAGLALKLGHVHGSAPFEAPDVSDVQILYVQRQLNVGATPYLDYRPYRPGAPPQELPPGATQSAGWVEYPVGIGAAMWAAAQPADDADQFLVITAVGLSAAALLTVLLLAPTGARAYLFAAPARVRLPQLGSASGGGGHGGRHRPSLRSLRIGGRPARGRGDPEDLPPAARPRVLRLPVASR
jgi:hypothetical protein